MDSPWASRRRAQLTLILVLLGSTGLVIYLYPKLYTPPSCFDGKQNQEEVGRDCGGPCSLMCASQIREPEVIWTRVFEIAPGNWSVAAYVQHTNTTSHTTRAPYRITVYDRDGRVILERDGETFITGDPVFAIVESKIDPGARIPFRATLSWSGTPLWYRTERTQGITVEEREIVPLPLGVEVRALVRNELPIPVENIEVAAIIYDANQNAIAVSRTFVEYIAPRQSTRISFAWPQPFPVTPNRLEFIPRVRPD